MNLINAIQEIPLSTKPASILDYFAEQPRRSEDFTLCAAGISLDFSRQYISQAQWQQLVNISKNIDFDEHIRAMFAGDTINNTEQRAVLHTALRANSPKSEIANCLNKMRDICQRVQHQQWQGATGQTIKYVVNIGIGGSDLGPRMVTEALSHRRNNLDIHFAANIDSNELFNNLKELNASETLFIASSKSWSTIETLSNIEKAITWLETAGISRSDAFASHLIAVTSKPEKAAEMGINTDHILPIWDWVGGRFSLWSAMGLIIALATSFEDFTELLAGANAMDKHFQTAPLVNNIPIVLALLEVWHVNRLGNHSQAIIPYSHKLRYLTSHLQQLIMESNGKRVNLAGETLGYATSPVIWGTVGTVGQHSYCQLLHQGTESIPVDFLIPTHEQTLDSTTNNHMIANCLAQAETLMTGTSHDDQTDFMSLHKGIPGNRSSNIISFDTVNAINVGAIIAMYEHKVFASSLLWRINAFDQWGVELGKINAKTIFKQLQSKTVDSSNPATRASLDRFLNKN